MRKVITGIVLAGTALLTLAGCTSQPTPAVTVTTTVTATPPAAAPLAELRYTPGSTDTSITFTAPTDGYLVVVSCKNAGGTDISYTETSPDKPGYGGVETITCNGKQSVTVKSAADIDLFDLGGKQIKISVPQSDLSGVTSLDLSVRKIAF